MKAFYVRDNNLIASGDKTAVLTPQAYSLNSEYALVVREDDKTFFAGLITFEQPITLTNNQVDKLHAEHNVSRIQRLKWWAGEKSFRLYRVKSYTPFQETIPTQVPHGVNMVYEIENCCSAKQCPRYATWEILVATESMRYCDKHVEPAKKSIAKYNLKITAVKSLKLGTIVDRQDLPDGKYLYTILE